MKDIFNFVACCKSIACCALLITGTACTEDRPDDPETDFPSISEANRPVPNPYLAAEHYSITHFNSSQTDAFPYPVKTGTFYPDIEECEGGWSGPVNLMTLASTDPDYMWGMGSDRVSYIRVSDGAFTKLAEEALPGVQMRTREQLETLIADYGSVQELQAAAVSILGTTPQNAMSGGNYVLCDKDNYAYSNIEANVVRYRLKDASDPSKGIEQAGMLNLNGHNILGLVGLAMTYDGNLVVVFGRGIAVVDRELTTVKDIYKLPNDQLITNSIAVGEDNGIYLASGSIMENTPGLMQKIMWTGTSLSTDEADGAWQATYEGGPKPPSIKIGMGTGSTPTLMGFGSDPDKLVVITDGAKHMKLTAYWRDGIPSDAPVVDPENPRLAGEIEVTCGLPEGTEWIQSEQSVAVAGYGAFVVNNLTSTPCVGDKIVDVLAIGPLMTPPSGVERFQWNTEKNEWESVWARADVSSVSMIPAISTSSGMVFVSGYSSADGWDVEGLDWNTGATIHRVVLGKSNRCNGAYAILQYLPNGDLLFNSVCGPFRVKL